MLKAGDFREGDAFSFEKKKLMLFMLILQKSCANFCVLHKRETGNYFHRLIYKEKTIIFIDKWFLMV